MTVAAYTGTFEPPTPLADTAAKMQRVIRRPDGSHLAPRLDMEQAALAILADCTGDDELALRLCKAFRLCVISQLPHDRVWALPVDDVRRWVRHHVPMADSAVPWARRDVSGDGAVDIH
jgi:hypothetical protein